MIKEEIFQAQTGSVRLIGHNTDNLPMWAINHYFRTFCDNYAKLVMMMRVCRMMQMGAEEKAVCAVKESAPLLADKGYANKMISRSEDNIVRLYEEEFWYIIQKYERPVVFAWLLDGAQVPLYDGFAGDAVKLEQISYHCPISIEPSGIVGALVDLALAGPRYEMERQEHEARQIANLAAGCERIVRAMQVIEDDRTPEGIKAYARETMQVLMEKQNKLNRKLGIELADIDIRG